MYAYDTNTISHIIESLVPKSDQRLHFLSVLLDSINQANSWGSQKWGIHCVSAEEKIRLLVGSFIVLTIGKGRIWMALDDNLLRSKDVLLKLSTSVHWQWDNDDYPEYKKIPSKNGYYSPQNSGFEFWQEIKALHFEFINKAAKRNSCLLVPSQSKHQPAILTYVERELRQYVPKPCYDTIGFITANEIDETAPYYEGAKIQILVNAYERDEKARQKCLDHFGFNCFVCGFSFEKMYGEIGKGFIHVHHLKPLSEIGIGYIPNPIKDLVPVCPNCHAMLHRRKPPFSIQELQDEMKSLH